ncbi:ABC transporter ATP-binding protein [Capsulimonas corticalis]|uniref:ABC transporter ATP-binding protein n=1 Tax=Capsulimonas corticalis TaxID=2219043 RepID=A0A402CU86_9BACT|nr:polysaccharide ABC transporter ATP-binding protein [Capsulimonas corticalis]BDI28885.1 ABC transporter ATP-binding protein [Capsulimonas corticalis]
MSSKDFAISVDKLSKVYKIVHNGAKHTTAAEALAYRIKNPLYRPESKSFWALRDISFDVRHGDVVGVIGRNGAGKSTLLKVLSQITEPSAGEVRLRGRVGSLLEVGTGFHAELTGRENIYLNGAILGMRRREIDKQFDSIVEFAEVTQFLDTPVKRYSSGMYVRLAFAVAAHLETEILIIDEVLAVGDVEFQKKCLGKVGEVAKAGRTVLFVSHNMAPINAMCNVGIVLDGGRIDMMGDVTECVKRYLMNDQQTLQEKVFTPSGGELSLDRAAIGQDGQDDQLWTSRPTIVEVDITSSSDLRPADLICGFTLRDAYGNDAFSTYFNDMADYAGKESFRGKHRLRCEIPSHFLNDGTYRIVFNIGVATIKQYTSDEIHFLEFTIANIDGLGTRLGGRPLRPGAVLPLFPWDVME